MNNTASGDNAVPDYLRSAKKRSHLIGFSLGKIGRDMLNSLYSEINMKMSDYV
jgi:hypothetical protein